jgi:hypothetical protein
MLASETWACCWRSQQRWPKRRTIRDLCHDRSASRRRKSVLHQPCYGNGGCRQTMRSKERNVQSSMLIRKLVRLQILLDVPNSYRRLPSSHSTGFPSILLRAHRARASRSVGHTDNRSASFLTGIQHRDLGISCSKIRRISGHPCI